MTLLQQSIAALFTSSLVGTLIAQPSFTIAPQIHSPAMVSARAQEIFIIPFSVTNNLSVPTSITVKGLPTAQGKAPGTALFVNSSTCNQPILPGKTCEIAIAAVGVNIAKNFQFSPIVCGFGDKVCSQADSNNRIEIIRNTNPIPEGTWKTLATVDQNTFPQFLAIDPARYQFAVGITSSNYLPVVVRCSISDIHNCSVPFHGLLEHNFSTLTDLSFDSEGNLYGLFIKSYESAPWNNETYPMKLVENSNTWSMFGSSFSGTGFGLDTSNPQNILISSQQITQDSPNDSVGLAQSFSNAGNALYAQTFLNAVNFGNIVNDGLGHIFVSGPELNPDASIQSHSKIWQWNPNEQTFTAIPMPDTISIITALVSDGQGILYASGLDGENNGQVWRYTVSTQSFEDTHINASYVTTLDYSPYGYLLAGGVNNTDYTGSIWYYSNNQWVDMNLPDSTNVVSIASNANNDIFATGFTSHNQAAVWLYNSIAQQQG